MGIRGRGHKFVLLVTKFLKVGWSDPGAKVCSGGCGIAIFEVYRDKSRFLTFAATDRDDLLFPRYVVIFVVFRVRLRFHCLLTVKFPGFLRSGPT